mmetsp:Transcript_20150/g.46354  ORF Transcript_20150/g.46354 Transcript_20150/m.46354 type:complete len:87 (+) Transcript_20150:279-539(+)
MVKTVWLRKFYFTVIGIGWIDFTRTSQCTSPTPRTGTALPVCCYRSLQAPMALYSLEFRFVGEVLAPAQMWTSASWVTGPREPWFR